MATTVSNVGKQSQLKKAEAFRRLHVPGNPIVLYNVWDAGSAKVVADSGAKAIATSSWAVAKAHGFNDGEQIPFDLAIQNLQRIVAAVDLPVSVDLESGYGEEPGKVAKNITLAIDAGAVGCNLEDSFPTDGKLREIADQVARIQGARQAADRVHLGFFVNARTDVFINTPTDEHNVAMVAEALKRAEAYKKAGADGLFVPGLADLTLIAKLTDVSALPINVLVRGSSPSISSLAKSGVARVSYGGTPYADLMLIFENTVREVTS